MFCVKCGTNNSADASFCLRCGGRLDNEEETRVANRNTEQVSADFEKQVFSISPTLKFVVVGYVLAILGAFLIVAAFTMIQAVSPIYAVLFGLLLLLVPAYFHLKKKLIKYKLTESSVIIDSGLISRTTQNIPLRRIQDVTVSSSLFQRVLGLGNVVIDNASESASKVVLANIDSPNKHAEILLRQMRLADEAGRRLIER